MRFELCRPFVKVTFLVTLMRLVLVLPHNGRV